MTTTTTPKSYWTMTRTEFRLNKLGVWDCILTFKSTIFGHTRTFNISLRQLADRLVSVLNSPGSELQLKVGTHLKFELDVHYQIARQIENIKNAMENQTIVNSQWQRYIECAKLGMRNAGYEGPLTKLIDCFPIETGAGFFHSHSKMTSNKYLPYLSAFLVCDISPKFKPDLVAFNKRVDEFVADTIKFEELLDKSKNKVITDELRIQELFDGHKVKYSKFLRLNQARMQQIQAFDQLTSNFGLSETMPEVESVVYAFLDHQFKKEN